MTDIKIPEIIETWKIAQAIGWGTGKTTKMLRDEGLATRLGKRNHVVMRADFAATMPAVYRIFVDKFTAGEISTKRRRTKRVVEMCPNEQDSVA